MKCLRLILFFVLALYISAPSMAQDASNVEAKPYGSYASGQIDSIDLSTGNVFLNIPLISFPQLGKLPPLSFSISLNNAPFTMTDSACDPDDDTCTVFVTRYDTSPPGAPYQGPLNDHNFDSGGWDFQNYTNGSIENMGAYITSSYSGSMVTGQLNLQNNCSCPTGNDGQFLYTLVDAGGTTHELETDTNDSTWNTYRTPDGTGYTFLPQLTPQSGAPAPNSYDPWNSGWNNTDWLINPVDSAGDGIRMGTIFSPTGIQYTNSFVTGSDLPPQGYGITPTALTTTTIDNSNTVSPNKVTRGPWYWTNYQASSAFSSSLQSYYSAHPPVFTDSVKRTIPDLVALQATIPIASSLTIPWTVPGPGGHSLTYTINYIGFTSAVAWNSITNGGSIPDTPLTGMGTSGWAIYSVQLPNGTSWGFDYDTNGDLLQVTTPTGGTIAYTYTTLPLSASGVLVRCNSQCHSVASRTQWDGISGDPASTTTYTYAAASSSSSCPQTSNLAFTTTETDDSGNQTLHTFCAIGSSNGLQITTQLFETETDYYLGPVNPASLMKKISTQYEYQWDIPESFGNPFTITDVLPTQITTAYGGGGTGATTISRQYMKDTGSPLFPANRITCNYFTGSPSCSGVTGDIPNSSSPLAPMISYVAPTAETVYSGTAIIPSAALRTTKTEFQFQANASYLTANMIALPQSVTIFGPAPATAQAAVTIYGYDETGSPSGAYGNQTSVNRWLNTTGGYITSASVQYDTQGRPSITKDANGNETSISGYMDQCAVSSPPSTFTQTVATAYMTPIQEGTTNVYDCNTGALTASTDPNGVQTNYIYTSDPLGRLTQVQSAVGTPSESWTTLSYPSMTEVDVAQDKATKGDGLITAKTIYDGLGRTIHQTDPAGYTVDTSYNLAGQVATVSNPHGTSPSPTDGITSYAYDPLGRVVQQTQPDQSQLSWVYAPPNVSSWDENGDLHQQTTNSLNQLATVSDAGGITTYSYDALGNLSNVSQAGAMWWIETPRVRTFQYNSLSQLQWSKNPETGVICYGHGNGTTGGCGTDGYDLNGNLLYKTDARSVTTNYTYDALNRLTLKTHSDGSAGSQYTYDQLGYWGAGPCTPNASVAGYYQCYGIGRLTSSNTTDGSVAEIYGYDAMGRLTLKSSCLTVQCGHARTDQNISYDLAGNLATYNDGTGVRQFTNQYDSAGRLLALISNTSPASLFSAPSYNPAGGLMSAVYGSGLMLNRTYDSRLRVMSETDGFPESSPSPTTITLSGTELTQ